MNQYRDALAQALRGPYEVNERTGEGVNISTKPVIISYDQQNLVQLPGLRKVGVKSSAAEVAWIIKGEQHTDWLRKYTHVWEPFKDEELVLASYGYRWRTHFRTDQLAVAVNKLRVDPTNRRCWISTWDPAVDLADPWMKMHPCPVGFALHQIDKRLNLTVVLRSSDAVIGYPHDLITFQLLRDVLARTIGIASGSITMVLCHFHVYLKHRNVAYEMCRLDQHAGSFCSLDWTMEDIITSPDEYVNQVMLRVPDCLQPTYRAKLEVAK